MSGASQNVQDTLAVQYYTNTTYDTSAATAAVAPLVVLRDWQNRQDIGGARKADTLLLAAGDLSGRTIAVKRADAEGALCSVVPIPSPLPPTARTARRTTQFIADGAIGSALRGGASGSTTTGSLGIDHLDIKSPKEKVRYLLDVPYWFTRKADTAKKLPAKQRRVRLIPLMAEQLKALITVASSVDTFASSSRTSFRNALLAPAMAAQGQIGSGSVEYLAKETTLSGSQGPRLNFTFAKMTWRLQNTDSLIAGKDTNFTQTETLTIGSFDARWRWTPLEQLLDPKGNDFAFAVELGYTSRWIAGDGAADSTFMAATLGADNRRWFNGLAASFVIALRQVTATADFPWLFTGPKELRTIRGLQPLITMRFSAPMFTF